MKVWGAIFNIFAILIILMLLIVYYNESAVIEQEFQEIRLKAAVSYSAEAAFLSTIEVEDVGIEYRDIDAVTINPGDCLDIFESMLCLNYNLSPSEENKAMIEEYIPVAVLVCNDGYYITTLSDIDTTPTNGIRGGEYGLKWSIKKPYTLKNGNTLYSVNLRDESWVSARTEYNATSGKTEIKIENGEANPLGLSGKDYKNLVLREVNSKVTKDMLYQIDKANINKKDWNYTFYLPPVQTTTGINPIDKPSLLLLVQGVDFVSTRRLDVVNMAGLKTIRKRVVIAFEVGGKRYYCYEGQLDASLMGNVKGYFNSMEDAARNDYRPHYEFLQRKVNYE